MNKYLKFNILGEPLCLTAFVAKKKLSSLTFTLFPLKGVQGTVSILISSPLQGVWGLQRENEKFPHKDTRYHQVLIIWILFIIGSSLSQPALSQNDSLYHYLEIAAKNNPVVLQKFAEYQTALQKIPQAGSLPDPQLSAGVFLSPMELVNGNQVADIRLMQMFPWFGVLKYGKDEMSLMAKSKYELFRDAKLQVYYEVQRKWYELYKIEKNIYYSEKNIEILKTISNLSVERYKTGNSNSNNSNNQSAVSAGNVNVSGSGSSSTGMGSMNKGQANPSSTVQASSMQQGSMVSPTANTSLADIYRIQIESGDLENNIELLKSQKRTAMAQFNSFLNRPPLSSISIPENLTPDSLGITELAVLDSIQTNNPMLGMIAFEKQSIEARKRMVKNMGFPMVGIGLNYSLINKSISSMGEPSMNGKDMLMPMLSLSLPVYRKKYKAMKSEALYLEKAAGYNYQSVANELQTEYYEALQLMEDAMRRIRLYDYQLQLSGKSLDIIIKSYSASTSDLTEVLRARQQTFEYELKKVEALTEFNTAVAWLRRLGSIKLK